jgi:hypothetical protein
MHATDINAGSRLGRTALALLMITSLLATALVWSAPAASSEEAAPEVSAGELPPTPGRVEKLQAVAGVAEATPEATADVLVASQAAGPIDMRLLVIAPYSYDQDLETLTGALERLGVPYDTFIASERTLDQSVLWDATGGNYQGIILANGQMLDTSFNSLFDATEWQTLATYQSMFGVRQVSSYTYPCPMPIDYGLAPLCPVDGAASAVGTLTTAGREVFRDLNPATPITFKDSWLFLAEPGANTVPLIQTAAGEAIASIHTYADGRETLNVTSAARAWTTQDLLLSYGLIDWVTKGLFLGERHVNLDVQVDDLLMGSETWDIENEVVRPDVEYRMSAADLASVIAWQDEVAGSPLTPGFRLEFAFNGSNDDRNPATDPLTQAVIANRAKFGFISHTFDHMNLDIEVPPDSWDEDLKDKYNTYAGFMEQLVLNDQFARNVLLVNEADGNYSKETLVQPDISGLENPLFHEVANDFGLRYLISDTSRPGGNNPSPNAGFYLDGYPSILVVPRRPSNLFYYPTTPEEWVSQFNYFYGDDGVWPSPWNRDLTYAEILDVESSTWLTYLLKWDLDPLMFHQGNLRDYGSGRSLLGDLLDATLEKYEDVYTLPIRTNSFQETGELMEDRMGYDDSGVQATRDACSMTVSTTDDATIPITGVQFGDDHEVYGDQVISYVEVAAGAPVTIPLPGEGCNTPVATIVPSSLAFGEVDLGVTSPAQTVTVTNTGTAPLTLSTLAIEGANPADYALSANTCSGATIPAAGTCTVGVSFTPSMIGARAATIAFTSNAATSPHSIALSGTGMAPIILISPTTLAFGEVGVGTTSAAQTVTVSNGGNAPLVLGAVAVTGTDLGEFQVGTDTCSGASIPAAASCTIQVSFAPTAIGARAAALTFTANTVTSPHSIPLSGTGTAAIISITPTTLAFGEVSVGTTSAAQTVTVANTGNTPLVLGTLAIGGTNAGDYALSANTCSGASVPAAGSCAFKVTFAPSALGPRAAAVAFTSNAATSPHSIPLSGTGLTPIISITPPTLAFGEVNVGVTSAAQTVTIANTGNAPLVLGTLAIGGTNAGDYALSANTCSGASVPVAGSCTVGVTFTPSAIGARAATITFTSNAAGSPHSIPLSGTGLSPAISISPSTLAFGTVNLGTASAAQTVTVTNTGNTPLVLGTLAIGGTNAGDYALSANTCSGASLPAAGTCSVGVTFTPTAIGTRAAAITFTSNTESSPHSVPLSGTGRGPLVTVDPTTLAFEPVEIGATSDAQTVTVTNGGNAPLNIGQLVVTASHPEDFHLLGDGCSNKNLAERRHVHRPGLLRADPAG